MHYKILIYQQKLLGKILPPDYSQIKLLNPDLICLPEYFFNPRLIQFKEALSMMEALSKDLNCILIAGTTLIPVNEQLYNGCYILNQGQFIGRYDKVHLYKGELPGVTPGREFKVFQVNQLKIGVLICADVLYQDAWQKIAALKPDIIFVPTFSPYKKESIADKYKRDNEIFVKNAQLCQCVIVKVCGIGIYEDTRIQGRSLMATPQGIAWRVLPEQEDQPVIKQLEIEL